MHSEGTYGSTVGYKNPSAEELIMKALKETDPAKRTELYYKLHQIDYEDIPYLWAAMGIMPVANRDWVQGFYSNPVFSDHYYFYPIYKSLNHGIESSQSKGT